MAQPPQAQLPPIEQPQLLFHLQRLRDEVHRFAIGAHREKRSRAITASPLDEIPGIGPARKRGLLLHFGTASKVRAASLEDLQRAPGVSVEEIVAKTAGRLVVNGEIPEMKL